MPKEFIHCRDFGREVPLVSANEDDTIEMAVMEQDALKVGWSKDQEHVEVAIVQTVEGKFVEHGFESILDAGDEIDPEKALKIGRLTPRYMQFDRAGLNRAIRVLRQARDDAFGRDE